MRDTKPLLIILLSIGLIGTWVYHLYDKTQYSLKRNEVYIKDSASIADAVKDSLSRRFSDTILAMDTRLVSAETGSDSLKNQLNKTFGEINHLKNQINTILKNRSASRGDLASARQMITELQVRVDELNGTNNSIEQEKSRLSQQMQELTVQIDGLQQNIRTLSDQNQTMAEQIKLASVFVATEMNLNAMQIKANKEEETSAAKKADKFVASFVVQNPIHEYTGAEVIIVVVQPDGKVLEISDWNTGSFETRLHGVKSYTRLVKFDYKKGEQKQVIFSLNPNTFQKGTYQLQVWHKGVMIGQASKTLG